MSFIPSTAVAASLSPLLSQSSDAARARKLQLQKNLHHTEDVQELDDAAVDSISDHSPKEDQGETAGQEAQQESEEHLDIASLKNHPAPQPKPPSAPATPLPRLDISA